MKSPSFGVLVVDRGLQAGVVGWSSWPTAPLGSFGLAPVMKVSN